MHKVAVVVGSLRRESINRKFAHALARLGAGTFAFNFLEIGDLPLYNDDLWQDPPASVVRLKRDVMASDAVLFVTPEHNRSIPPVLKNAIDWASRPKGDNSWAGKPASIIGTSDGVIGTAVAQAHLRSVAVILGMILMGQPEVYFASKPENIDADGAFTDKSRPFLEKYLDRFDRWITRVSERPDAP